MVGMRHFCRNPKSALRADVKQQRWMTINSIPPSQLPSFPPTTKSQNVNLRTLTYRLLHSSLGSQTARSSIFSISLIPKVYSNVHGLFSTRTLSSHRTKHGLVYLNKHNWLRFRIPCPRMTSTISPRVQGSTSHS